MQTYAGWPMTPMVKWILIATSVVWVLEVFTVNWLETGVIIEHLALIPISVFPGMELWQPATYMWLHSPTNFMHILFNCLFLWMFGGNLELDWGSKAFLRFYLTCGIGAGIVVLISGLFFAPTIPVLGASGAIYGLVVAWAIAYPNKQIYFFGIFPMKGKHFVLIPIGFAAIEFLTRAQGVSHAAHLGGMAIGALLVTGYWRPDKARRRLRYWWLRRKLRVIEQDHSDRPRPPDGGYWH
ncbi:MAG: rhomboid family intramembrane serine protease [Proteobacteria bacterium]|nr:rhomboid family intramembrane serine protease [Pseudomonadota bacterium]